MHRVLLPLIGCWLFAGLACDGRTHHEPAGQSEVGTRPAGADPPAPVNQVTINIHSSRSVPPGGEEAARENAILPPSRAGADRKLEFPEPPAKETGDPERFIHYYCKCWKDEEFNKMYGMLDAGLREELTFTAFRKRFGEDAEFNSGLRDERIIEKTKDIGSQMSWRISLVFRSDRAKPRTIIASLKKTLKGYRLLDSGLIPLDLDNP